ncbi:conserved hypothetical protein [Mesorhizobium metallidurans STM 2683]|uniref:Uncharacterized protein n=1 Tax=Mesorhizobium metallidurans STM 2683 TaxID=1297569 RepID=M5EHX4_9HYPH|nr:hypothetical protein [Mesorhizobium metallidurans]CCV04219.1 conserved hypothetical protein [Mesorhizobium metallidurans STM 2683]
MQQPRYVNTGNGPGTAIAVFMAGLMAIGIVFVVLGGALYLNEETNERSLSTVPARAVMTVDGSSAR